MAERKSQDPPAPRTDPPSIDEQLDEALADSFPASDPVSFVTSQTEEDWGDSPRGGGQPKPKEP
jgi:hypothetical protein